MGITSITLLTIGQAPRPDMAAHIEAIIPASVELTQVGLLDGVLRSDVEVEYAVQPGEMPLVTRLRDGHVISISSGKAQRALQPVIDRLAAGGVGAIVLMCTGQFTELRGGPAWLIRPDTIVPAVLSALVPGTRIGVILPKQEQIGAEPVKWESVGVTPLYAAASPYDEDSSALESAGLELVASGAQVVLLDCMGYSSKHEDVLRNVIDVPVVVSNKVIAGALTSLF